MMKLKYFNFAVFGLVIVGTVLISGCINQTQGVRCEWNTIASKYEGIKCSGTITNGNVDVFLSAAPSDAKLIYAAAIPCELRDGNLACIGSKQSCSITSDTQYKASCPSLGRMAVELRFSLPAEQESECFNSYAGQPPETCWFGTATLFG